MKRVTSIGLILTLSLLAGCVVTPAYRYNDGAAGYYYGQQPYQGSTVVYGAWYPSGYGGYYGPWAPYTGGRYHDDDDYHGGHRRQAYRHDNRFARRFQRDAQRQVNAPRPQRSQSTTRQTRSVRHTRSSQRRERLGIWHKKHPGSN